jgi:hypothetical protein
LEAKKYSFGILKNEVSETERHIEEIKQTLASEIERLGKLNSLVADNEAKIKTESEAVAALVDPDLSIFSERLKNVEATNRNVRALQEKKTALAELAEKQSNAEALTKEIARLEKEKTDAVASAKFPVAGLGFDDNGVTFNGIPFSQSSAGEKLRVSVAVAMALSPKLRVIRITDGSLIDSKNMEILSGLAKENDFQLWIEKVDETGKIGIYIEDGEVKA